MQAVIPRPSTNTPSIVLALAAFVLMLALPEFAHATASTDKVEQGIENLVTLLTAVGVGIISAAIMVAGYKMAFSGARLSDVSNILIGGVLAGGASGLAAWVFS
jgi:type IV secretion system protein VirB2